jgi:hypothetical protein
MNNTDTDLIFPPRVISALSSERGLIWKKLVDHAQISGANSIDKIAFILLMAQLNNCALCNADSYRAIQGCTICAKQALKRFHDTDDALVQMFDIAKSEVSLFIQSKSLLKNRQEL